MTEAQLVDFDLMLDQLYDFPERAETIEELDGNVEYLSRLAQGQNKIISKWAHRYSSEEGSRGLTRLSQLLGRTGTGKYSRRTLELDARVYNRYGKVGLYEEFPRVSFSFFRLLLQAGKTSEEARELLEKIDGEDLTYIEVDKILKEQR